MVSRALIGKELSSVSFPVELSKVMEMASALHDEDVTYRDEVEATARGFAGVPAPLTVTALAAHWNPDGPEGTALELGSDLKRLLHGETTWEYLRPVHAGDRLTTERRVTDVSERSGKRGGLMTMVTLQIDYRNQNGEIAIRQRDVLIERGGD